MHQRHGPPRTAGFTLIELLIVVSIIGILTSIVLVAGARVRDVGRVRATEGVLRTLDQTLTNWIASRDTIPPSEYRDERGFPYPMIDARSMSASARTSPDPNISSQEWEYRRPAEPSVQIYAALLQRDDPASAKMLDAVLDSFKRVEPVVTALDTAFGPMNNLNEIVQAPILLDAWGQPLRFVHPRYHGGYGDTYITGPSTTYQVLSRPLLRLSLVNRTFDFRRSAQPFDPLSPQTTAQYRGDADEGLCVNNRPYFYSGGLDLNPGTRADNINSQRPNYPAVTTSIQD
jgi:prepilin-type N-terminal cleavage/methylation domain-containing protein